ncbi:MAG: hypothetical protein PHD58_01850 [Anaerolineales bacterium]|nr:hypothetical protein [Anaerolineales bacterium]
MHKGSDEVQGLPLSRVFHAWWPLAASWFLIGVEQPAVTAVIARLAEPEINLAAFGGVVFPLSLIVEAPIIMLLAASTALSRDWSAYQKLRRYMLASAAALSLLHFLVAFTPLYYLVVRGLIGVPEAIVEPARIGLMAMLPWSGSIAYRRFNQGVLIRFGHSRAISVGTVVRLSANFLVLGIGYALRASPGILVGAGALSAGVVAEALYVRIVVRPVLREQVKSAPQVGDALHLRAFLEFYIPLALTSLLFMLAQPLGSAALSRMPQALESLAVWPVVSGLLFILRSMGVAYNEVVLALLDRPRAVHSLRRFTLLLALVVTGLLLLIIVTPFSTLWFQRFSGLPVDLAELARTSLWIGLPLPALSALQSWFQGAILFGRKTRAVTQAVLLYLAVTSALLALGVYWGKATGLYVGIAVMSASMAVQTAWLWQRSRPVFSALLANEAGSGANHVGGTA